MRFNLRFLPFLVVFFRFLLAANVIDADQNLMSESSESSSSFLTDSESVFYPQNFGIFNSKLSCYLNSMIACLYTIPCFQEKIYELVEKENYDPAVDFNRSTLLSTARAFIQMRISGNVRKNVIDLKHSIVSSMKSVRGWRFGDFEDVIEFWEEYIESLPDEIQSLFRIETEINHFSKNQQDSRVKSGEISIRKSLESFSMFLIPAPEKDTKLSELIESKFVDLESDDFVISPEDQGEFQHVLAEEISEKVKIPQKITTEIKNSPEMLVFGVKRRGYDFHQQQYTVNKNRLEADLLKINGEFYALSGFVSFHENHYYSFVRDIQTGFWFLHNDTDVMKINFDRKDARELFIDSLNHRGTMFFYVKNSNLLGFLADSEKYANLKDISEIVLERTKMELPLKMKKVWTKRIINQKKIKVKKTPAYEITPEHIKRIVKIELAGSKKDDRRLIVDHGETRFALKANWNKKFYPYKSKKKIFKANIKMIRSLLKAYHEYEIDSALYSKKNLRSKRVWQNKTTQKITPGTSLEY